MAVRPASVDTLTGVIAWEQGSFPEVEPVQQELSPFLLKRLDKIDERIKQEHRKFRSVDNLPAAKASRDRQVVSYPKMIEETDGSKSARTFRRSSW